MKKANYVRIPPETYIAVSKQLDQYAKHCDNFARDVFDRELTAEKITKWIANNIYIWPNTRKYILLPYCVGISRIDDKAYYIKLEAHNFIIGDR